MPQITIKLGSPEYLRLGRWIRKVAEYNLKFNGSYSYVERMPDGNRKVIINP